jgi:hypothetical protein
VTRAALVPLGALLAYGLVFGAAALGTSLPAYDDHPGQFFRLWHALNHGLAPWTWNPDWWMGFAELQFYPPGFAYLGAAIHYLALTALSPASVYQVLLWIIYLAPGVTTFLLLARLAPSPWFALPGAFVALTLSAGTLSGVEFGVRTGLIAARLGWALLPLLALVLVRWVERGGVRPASAALILAGIVLSHPAHAPAAVALILLAALAGTGGKPYRLFQGGWLVLTAAGFTAFWSVPLLAHLDGSRALAWGDSAWSLIARAAVAGPLPPALLLFAALAPVLERDRVTAVLTLCIPVMLVVIALDRSTRLPANRLADGLVLGVVLAAGLGLSRALGALWLRVGGPEWLTGMLAVLVIVALSSVGSPVLTVWPHAGEWPSVAELERPLRLPALWRALREAPAGRVFFVRSGVPLAPAPPGRPASARPPWYRPHTHVTALAPLFAGRAIVNGTFTHPSPIAGLVYYGTTDARPVTTLVEQLDGERLFGRELGPDPAATAAPSAFGPFETFEEATAFLGVSTVVMLEEDIGRFPALETSDGFTATSLPPYVIYTTREPAILPEQVARDRWRAVLGRRTGEWVSARTAFSPLWSAESLGEQLRVRRGGRGDLEVRVPAANTTVDLVYRDGHWEQAGIIGSGLGVLLWIAPWLQPERRRRAR